MKTRPATTGHRVREKRDPEATRQALLRAGAELFSERGFDGVPIEEVADRAGVNKALISYHFRGKRGLYVAILESAFAAMAERLRAIEAGCEQRPRDAPGLPRGLRAVHARAARLPHPVPARGARGGHRPGRAAPPPRDHRGLAAPRRARGARGALPPGRSPPLPLRPRRQPRLLLRHRAGPAQGAPSQARVPFPMPDSDAFLRYLEELTLRGLAPENPAVPSAAKERTHEAPRESRSRRLRPARRRRRWAAAAARARTRA